VRKPQTWLTSAVVLCGACVLPEVGRRDSVAGSTTGGAGGRVVTSESDAVSSDAGAGAVGMTAGASGRSSQREGAAGTNAGASGATAAVSVGGAGGAGPAMLNAGAGGRAAGSGDPCLVNNGGCDLMPHAECASHDGVVTGCSCPGGYKGDGRGDNGCVDIDECATNNGGCDTSPQATCINHVGAAPGCMCPAGSMGDGVGSEGCKPVSSTSGGSFTACGKYMCDAQTVKDSATGLTWQRKLPATYDGCTGKYSSSSVGTGDACTWDEAKAYCVQLTLEGTGWRLPTKDELLSLVDMTRTDPSIDVVAFPNTPSTPSNDFWSASPYVGASGNAWRVNFSNGYSNYDDVSLAYRVRCVR
jgi:hypothetical protein